MKKWSYELLLLCAVALWGSSFALTKPLLDVMGVFTFMAYRFLTGGIILIVFLKSIGRFKPGKNQWIGGLITGLLLFLAFIFHTYGLKYTTASKNAFIVGSNVIFVPLIMMVFKKERQPRQVWLSTFLAVVGLGMITLDGTLGGVNKGDLITLVGTLVVGFYILAVEAYVKSGSSLEIATIQVLTVGLLSLIPALVMENVMIDFTPIVLGNLFVLSVGCTSIAYVIANYCQRFVSAARTSLLYVFEPIFGAVLGWILLGERFGVQGMIGAVLVTVATILPSIIGQEEITI